MGTGQDEVRVVVSVEMGGRLTGRLANKQA